MLERRFQDKTLNLGLERVKRAAHRGQTQSQYLSFGGDDDGKAEAEATNVSFDI